MGGGAGVLRAARGLPDRLAGGAPAGPPPEAPVWRSDWRHSLPGQTRAVAGVHPCCLGSVPGVHPPGRVHQCPRVFLRDPGAAEPAARLRHPIPGARPVHVAQRGPGALVPAP